MSCRYAMLTLGNERVLRFECEGCGRGASIENSEDCMKGVTQALVEHPDASAVVLADLYEREYRGPSLVALKEIAQVLADWRYWPFLNLTTDGCDRCEAERKERLTRVLEMLPGNPLRARDGLKRLLQEVREGRNRGAQKCIRCKKEFLERLLEPIVHSLERTGLGGRAEGGGYAGILQPLVRPRFLASRLSLEPPPRAELVDVYELEGGDVRIYRMPEELQHLYFLVPFEYRLSNERVQLMHLVRRQLLERQLGLETDPIRAREQLVRMSSDLMTKLVVETKLQISKEDIECLARHFARLTAGFGLLETLLSDPKVQDIYIDAPVGKTPVHLCHADYEECLTNIYLTPDDAESMASRFRAISGRPFSEADPILDLNLRDVRIAAIGRPLSPGGMAFALRRHKPTPWTLPQFVRTGFLTPYAAGLLSLLVDGQASILVTGSRGAGKTSLIGALMFELLPKFRILTLEDTAELPVAQLRGLGFRVQELRVQPAIGGSDVELRAEDALRAALRLGESVLVVGEVRSSEAKTLFEAMRVGAVGNSVMGTIHGASARDVFERIVYDLGVPPSSFKATDAIVVTAPIRPRGSITRKRRVVQVAEVSKGWREDPAREGGFKNLLSYDPASEGLKLTRALGDGSELISNIARKWGTGPGEVIQNLELRAKIHATLVEAAAEFKKSELLEAEFVVRSNLAFHALLEKALRRGRVNYREIFRGWGRWFENLGIRDGLAR